MANGQSYRGDGSPGTARLDDERPKSNVPLGVLLMAIKHAVEAEVSYSKHSSHGGFIAKEKAWAKLGDAIADVERKLDIATDPHRSLG